MRPFSLIQDDAAISRALGDARDNRSALASVLKMTTGVERACTEFLIRHMPQRDLRSATPAFLLEHIGWACQARTAMPWGPGLPDELFYNNVLPYGNVNERCDQWRRDFFRKCAPLVRECRTAAEAAQALNRSFFSLVGVAYHPTKRKFNHQSPYESIELKFASCTGLSILLVDACRSVAIPARLAGVPQWSTTDGNHSWVEIWDGQWFFMGAAEPGPLNVTGFLGCAAAMDSSDELHRIYAVSFAQATCRFPMVWALDDTSVNAVDVTKFYTARIQAELHVLDAPSGAPVNATVVVRRHGFLCAKAEYQRLDDGIHPVVLELPADEAFDVELIVGQNAAVKTELKTGLASHQRFALFASGAPPAQLTAEPGTIVRIAAAELPRDIGPQPLPFSVPRGYVCMRAPEPIVIDGSIDKPVWQKARWSDVFLDIEGPGRPVPRFKTRMKMLWDDQFLYIAADLEEPHVWASIAERNAVIFNDNDFEVFIDPDGDGHEYFEFEVNALNTVWNLFLNKPYKNGGEPVVREMEGQKTAVAVRGTLNKPDDTDEGWTIELAFPWAAMAPHARTQCPPRDGDQWRINFSRVEWQHDVVDGVYRRVPCAPEDNWVWSPQGVVNMHRPETWGYVQFSLQPAGTTDPFRADSTAEARWLLHHVQYAQAAHHARNGAYAGTLDALGLGPLAARGVALAQDGATFTARIAMTAQGDALVLSIGPDARIALQPAEPQPGPAAA